MYGAVGSPAPHIAVLVDTHCGQINRAQAFGVCEEEKLVRGGGPAEESARRGGPEGGAVADDRGEAAFVVDTVRQWVEGKRSSGGDFAIMYRTNAQSRLLEEAFLYAGLPYRLVGALRFYGRREVKDLVAFLRLVNNPDDEVSLARVINIPPRGIGDKTQLGLQLAARQANYSPGKLLLEIGAQGDKSPHWGLFTGRSNLVLADFGALLHTWRSATRCAACRARGDRRRHGVQGSHRPRENVAGLHRCCDKGLGEKCG